MNKDSWPLQSEWLDAYVIRELIVIYLIYLPQVVKSCWVPSGDLNTTIINKIWNHTKVIFKRPGWFTAGREAWSKIVFMWCVLPGEGEAGVLGELNSSVDLLHGQCTNSYKGAHLNLFFLSILLFPPVFPLKRVLKECEALCVSRKLVSECDSDTACEQSPLSPLHLALARYQRSVAAFAVSKDELRRDWKPGEQRWIEKGPSLQAVNPDTQ